MQWLNEPPVWKADDGRLRVVSGAKTDFWRVTHYGFVRDNGHFYYEQRAGDLTVQVKIEAKYEALYDQAGIMVRLDSANWIKTGAGRFAGPGLVAINQTRQRDSDSIFGRWPLLSDASARLFPRGEW